MTDTEWLALMGVIYIAPHIDPKVSRATGTAILILAAARGLEWI